MPIAHLRTDVSEVFRIAADAIGPGGRHHATMAGSSITLCALEVRLLHRDDRAASWADIEPESRCPRCSRELAALTASPVG